MLIHKAALPTRTLSSTTAPPLTPRGFYRHGTARCRTPAQPSAQHVPLSPLPSLEAINGSTGSLPPSAAGRKAAKEGLKACEVWAALCLNTTTNGGAGNEGRSDKAIAIPLEKRGCRKLKHRIPIPEPALQTEHAGQAPHCYAGVHLLRAGSKFLGPFWVAVSSFTCFCF